MSSLTASHIANYFLSKKNHCLNNLKINKLIYISLGWAFPVLDRKVEEPLFIEPVEAWKYGPVIPSIYHQFKKFGFGMITENAYILDYFADKYISLKIKDERIKDLLEQAWDIYGSYGTWDLVELTHKEGTPWHKTYNKDELFRVIPTKEIYDYYTKISKELN